MSTHSKLSLLAGVGLALTFAACTPPVAPAARPAVKLTISPTAARFSPGGPVTLALDFENVGTAPLRLSPIAEGNLRIVSLRRDGAAVTATHTTVSYSTSLRAALAGSLVAVAPGAHAQGTWTSLFDPDQSVPALVVVHHDPEGLHRALLRGVGAPGTYTAHVVYRFGDPWAQPADVFTGETNVAEVTFVVGS